MVLPEDTMEFTVPSVTHSVVSIACENAIRFESSAVTAMSPATMRRRLRRQSMKHSFAQRGLALAYTVRFLVPRPPKAVRGLWIFARRIGCGGGGRSLGTTERHYNGKAGAKLDP